MMSECPVQRNEPSGSNRTTPQLPNASLVVSKQLSPHHEPAVRNANIACSGPERALAGAVDPRPRSAATDGAGAPPTAPAASAHSETASARSAAREFTTRRRPILIALSLNHSRHVIG